MKNLKNFIRITLYGLSFPAIATTIFYDFNDQNNLGWSGVTGAADEVRWLQENGLSSSGAIGRTDNSNRVAAVVSNDTFTGNQMSFNVYFYLSANSSTSNTSTTSDNTFTVGFKDNSQVGQTNNVADVNRISQANNSVFAGIQLNNAREMRIQLGTSNSINSSDYELLGIEGWFYMTNQFNYTGTDNEWSLTTSIFNSDASGVFDPDASVLSHTHLFSDGPLLSNFSNVHAAMDLPRHGGDQRRTVRHVDNATITVIPEPGTLAMIGIAALAGLIGFRRRR
ncbi:MAG: PEP-CTERM sorting domain-containing protein [Verrucomicrobia bacterium]|nr:PEP-CTERM sorting domain-containing protein [Verrucomicrobiota bacterium]MCH8527817.1 PEP-CTERM sorting domain-containing protein [Kiritimatiellia bacterium]